MTHTTKSHQYVISPTLCLLGLLGLSLFASPVAAQVFDSGPSDPALFDNVINSPNPTAVPPSVVGGNGLTTQLNISTGVNPTGNGFTANSGAEVNVSGGFTGDGGFSLNSGSELNVSGGDAGSGGLTASSGSVVNVSGGEAGSGGFTASTGSEVNISGGEAGSGGFTAEFGSVVNISGGEVGSGGLTIESGGVLNISGGILGSGGFSIQPSGEFNLVGSEFFLGGVSLESDLATADPFSIVNIDAPLSGTLLDGSGIFLLLPPTSTVTVSLGPSAVPEPSALALLSVGGVALLGRRRKNYC